MTKKILLLFVSLAFNIGLYAQDTTGMGTDFEIPDVEHITEGIGGNLNFSAIGDQLFFGARFKPDLSFGKLGFGLDIPLLINVQTGKIRTDEFQDGVGVLRIIRYIRWGVKKKDPLYFRIGELSGAQLGFGMLLSDYDNSISFEKRKLGFEFDFVVKKKFGLEMIYSDLDLRSFNLLAVRPYYKPFGATSIPIVKTFEIGLGYATDHDQTVLTQNDSTIIKTNYFLDKGINSFSADMGFWIFNFKWLRWDVYAQAGYMPKIMSDTLTNYITNASDPFLSNYKNGAGWSIGTDFKFNFFGNLLKINYRAERFWNSDYYLSRFYNFGYELNKDEKILTLINTHEAQGMYFNLQASILDKIILKSNILFDDEINKDHPAQMTVGFDLSNMVDKLTLYTSLYKADITNISDLFSFDDKTMFKTLIGWRIYEVPVIKLQFNVGASFMWTYAFLRDGDFTATKYFSPYFSINIPLNEKKKTEENPETNEE